MNPILFYLQLPVLDDVFYHAFYHVFEHVQLPVSEHGRIQVSTQVGIQVRKLVSSGANPEFM